MNPILRNILAVVLGWLIGSAVNMGLVQLGYTIIPPLEGIDMNDMDTLIEVMPTLESKHFLFPFLAHALGTLVGAFIAAKVAANRKMTLAIVIGVIFLLGGIAVSFIIPAPTWFIATDLIIAYIPMAWLGGKLAIGNSKKTV